MSDTFEVEDIRYFSSWNAETKLLEYSKYTFLFEQYASDFALKKKNKVEIFDDFLLRNETDWAKITTVKEELTKYFRQMTLEVLDYSSKFGATFAIGSMNIQLPETYVSISEIVKNQWELKDYSYLQTRRLSDYFFTDKNKMFTKYNFNLEQYSKDYNVYGNYLEIFSDFAFRSLQLNGHQIGFYGSGDPGIFRSYFYDVDDLRDYMSKYGCTSIWVNMTIKNIENINYEAYRKLKNLPYTDKISIIEDYLRWGQYERLAIEFYPPKKTSIDINLESICAVYSKGTGSGFLYKNSDTDTNIYVVTCAHLVGVTNLNTFRASFNTSQIETEITTNIAEFKLIGRDMYTDILVGIFDPNLPFNVSNKVDISQYKKLKIDVTYKGSKGDSLYTMGSLGKIDNDAYLEGKLLDPYYVGNFKSMSATIPASYLIDIVGIGGLSGAPIFSKDNDEQAIGMITGNIKGKYLVGLTSFILDNICTNIIGNYAFYSQLYKDDPIKLSFFLKNGYPKTDLGVNAYYYHPEFSKKYIPTLSNLNYLGGLLVTDFIIGWNYENNTYIYDTDTLAKQSTIALNTPLLQTKLYKRFLDSSKNPIVIKWLEFYDGLIGEYKKFYIGKYGTQDGYQRLIYGLTTTGTVATSKFGEGYFNKLVRTISTVNIGYYYYDGVNWIFDTEEVGGNGPEWYTTFTDTLGNKFLQNRFKFSELLVPYQHSYIYSLNPGSSPFAVNYSPSVAESILADPCEGNDSNDGPDASPNTYSFLAE